jgi:hypothetical protein
MFNIKSSSFYNPANPSQEGFFEQFNQSEVDSKDQDDFKEAAVKLDNRKRTYEEAFKSRTDLLEDRIIKDLREDPSVFRDIPNFLLENPHFVVRCFSENRKVASFASKEMLIQAAKEGLLSLDSLSSDDLEDLKILIEVLKQNPTKYPLLPTSILINKTCTSIFLREVPHFYFYFDRYAKLDIKNDDQFKAVREKYLKASDLNRNRYNEIISISNLNERAEKLVAFLKLNPEFIPDLDSVFHEDSAFLLKLFGSTPQLICYLDRDLILKLLNLNIDNILLYIPNKLSSDQEISLMVIKKDASQYRHVASSLKKDLDFIAKSIEANVDTLRFLEKKWTDCAELARKIDLIKEYEANKEEFEGKILKNLVNKPSLFQDIPFFIKGKDAFLANAYRLNRKVAFYFNRDEVAKLITLGCKVTPYISESLKRDEDLIFKAILSNKSNFEFAGLELKANKSFLISLIEAKPVIYSNISYDKDIPEELKNDRDMAFLAVTKMSMNYSNVPEYLKNDFNFFKEVITASNSSKLFGCIDGSLFVDKRFIDFALKNIYEEKVSIRSESKFFKKFIESLFFEEYAKAFSLIKWAYNRFEDCPIVTEVIFDGVCSVEALGVKIIQYVDLKMLTGFSLLRAEYGNRLNGNFINYFPSQAVWRVDSLPFIQECIPPIGEVLVSNRKISSSWIDTYTSSPIQDIEIVKISKVFIESHKRLGDGFYIDVKKFMIQNLKKEKIKSDQLKIKISELVVKFLKTNPLVVASSKKLSQDDISFEFPEYMLRTEHYYKKLTEEEIEEKKNKVINTLKTFISPDHHIYKYLDQRCEGSIQNEIFDRQAWPYLLYFFCLYDINSELIQNDSLIMNELGKNFNVSKITLCAQGMIELAKNLLIQFYSFVESNDGRKEYNDSLGQELKLNRNDRRSSISDPISEVINDAYVTAYIRWMEMIKKFLFKKYSSTGMQVHYGNIFEDLRKYWFTDDKRMYSSINDKYLISQLSFILEDIKSYMSIPHESLLMAWMWDDIQKNKEALKTIETLEVTKKHLEKLSKGEIQKEMPLFQKEMVQHWDLTGYCDLGVCTLGYKAAALYALAEKFPTKLPTLEVPLIIDLLMAQN